MDNTDCNFLQFTVGHFFNVIAINNFWFASPLLLVVFLVLGLIGGASTGIGRIKNISGR